RLWRERAVAMGSRSCPEYEGQALRCPPSEVSWLTLDHLAERDPELARRRWEEVKQAALVEVRTGYRAAAALEGYQSRAWERARFLAVRAELTQAWRPRNGLEQQLVDQLAGFQVLLWTLQEAPAA